MPILANISVSLGRRGLKTQGWKASLCVVRSVLAPKTRWPVIPGTSCVSSISQIKRSPPCEDLDVVESEKEEQSIHRHSFPPLSSMLRGVTDEDICTATCQL
jgi:hypothetical protein